jgi:hypothetical protein
MAYVKTYLKNIFLAVSQVLNVLLGGDPDETLSSRAGKARLNGRAWGCILCKVLDRLDKNHCTNAIENDEGKNAVKP